MPRPKQEHAQIRGNRFVPADITKAEHGIAKLRYRLQVERVDAEGVARWVTLRGHDTIEPLLRKGPEVAGRARIVKGKAAELVIEWRDGQVCGLSDTERAWVDGRKAAL
jgi:hypothetical protein